jgi:uridine phosphorylase
LRCFATDILVNSFIASEAGFGFDGLLHFYDYKNISDEALVEAFVAQTGWNERLPYPYCVDGDSGLMKKIGFDMMHGITASAGGFYGPQGRELRG